MELVSKISKPKKPDDAYPDAAQQMFHWAGQLREYAAVAAEEGNRPLDIALAALDAAVADHGEKSRQSYKAGRAQSLAIHRDFDKQIAAAASTSVFAKLKIERRQMARYAAFPYEQAAQQVLAALDE